MRIDLPSFTNSALACAHRCPRELELRYGMQLAPAREDREVLQVGSTWHRAHDAATKNAGDPHAAYDAIARHAPGELWIEKLRRLFAGYVWRWGSSPLPVVASEQKFDVPFLDTRARGQIDGVLVIDGKRGILERKTSGEDIDDGAPYWDRLRMDTQLSFYALAFRELAGAAPEFIVYDVVRKPTIRPKGIVKKDAERMRRELTSKHVATYYGDTFLPEEIDAALSHDQETSRMYGARLTADIGERPDFYYQRRVVARTGQDLDGARADAVSTIGIVRWLEKTGMPFPRNPNACNVFGLCDFFGLCSNNEYPTDGHVPDGFLRREHLHPELDDDN